MHAEFLTPDQAADYLGLKKSTLYVKCHRKELPYIKRAGMLRFEANELRQYLLAGRIEAKKGI